LGGEKMKKKVLLVDDDRDFLEGTRIVLEKIILRLVLLPVERSVLTS